MSDISKIKLGNTSYNIKDNIARTALSTVSLVSKTNVNINSGLTNISHLVFYEDANKTTIFSEVPLETLYVSAVGASLVVAAPTIMTNILGIDGTGIIDTTSVSVKLVNNKPVFAFNSTSDGTSSGTVTEVVLPVGASGTVALTSDITSAAGNKIGSITKTTTTPSGAAAYDVLNLFAASGDSTALDTVSLLTLNTQTLNAGNLTFDPSGFSGTYTGIKPETVSNAKQYTFTVGTSSSDLKTVVLPMGANGTIALTSDLTSILGAINDINSVLDLDGEDVTTTIDTFNEVKEFLEDYDTDDSLASLLAGKIESINYDTTGTNPILSYKKTSSGSATTITTVDITPTANSKNLITSGAVASAISGFLTSSDISDMAKKSEMGVSISDDTTTITLKTGTSATVINAHLDISGKADKTSTVTNVSYASASNKILKTINGTTSDVVTLPTASYDSSNETLVITLAS